MTGIRRTNFAGVKSNERHERLAANRGSRQSWVAAATMAAKFVAVPRRGPAMGAGEWTLEQD